MALNKHFRAKLLKDMSNLGIYGDTVDKVKETMVDMQLHQVIKDEWLCKTKDLEQYAKEANEQKAEDVEDDLDDIPESIRPLYEPAKHSLATLFRALKFGRPANDQNLLLSLADLFESELDVCEILETVAVFKKDKEANEQKAEEKKR